MSIAILLFGPVFFALVALVFRNRRLNAILTFVHSLTVLAATVWLIVEPVALTRYFAADGAACLVLGILALVYFAVAAKGLGDHSTEATPAWNTVTTAATFIFVGAMTGAALSTHAAMLWVFVEATTLASAPLIYISRTKTALEATWKYIFVCSIGIALAFIGVILLMLGMAPGASLFFEDLYAHAGSITVFWLNFSFPFILVGFGTKAGFAPVHAWLPDAHSEAPSGISALLSATLLNTALLAVLRFSKLLTSAGQGAFVRDSLLVIGFLSLFVSAVYMLRVKNYKRMLAYSSIENMGIIVIGFALGGLGAIAATLHMVAHSLAKAAFFLTAGDILHRWKSRETGGASGARGVLATAPRTGWAWIVSFVAISGFPPFPAFFSELMIVAALLAAGLPVLMVVFLGLLTVIMFGMGRAVLAIALGPKRTDLASSHREPVWPQFLLLSLAVVVGLFMPAPVADFLQAVAADFAAVIR